MAGLRDRTNILQYLPGSPGDSGSQFYVGGEIEIEDDGKSYSGYGTYVGGWNNGKPIDQFSQKLITDSKKVLHLQSSSMENSPRLQIRRAYFPAQTQTPFPGIKTWRTGE